MKTLAFERMRLQSQAHIKRLIDYHEQRSQLLSKKVERSRSCKYNAHSAFLLCAVNPIGPCSECGHYEQK